ncbi:hypothetical protein V8C86DRAFT_1418414 [Haematococcus lacustris]
MNWQWNGNEAPASLPGSLLGPVEGGSASNNLWDVEVLAQALQVLQGQHDTHQPTLGTVGPQLNNAYTVMPQEAQSGYSLHNSLSGNLGWPAPNHFMSDTTGHPAERELRAAQQLQQLTSTPEEFLLLERIAGDGFAATQVLAPLLQHRRELMVSGPPAMLPRTATVPPPPPASSTAAPPHPSAPQEQRCSIRQEYQQQVWRGDSASFAAQLGRGRLEPSSCSPSGHFRRNRHRRVLAQAATAAFCPS